MYFKALFLALGCLYLVGCNSTNTQLPAPPSAVIDNANFAFSPVESQYEIFYISPQLRSKLLKGIDTEADKLNLARELVSFIFFSSETSLDYQAGATLTAEQTFVTKDANCLSLSILAYSLAQELGLQAEFQQVFIPEYWANQGGYSLLTGHVNLKLRTITNRRNQDGTIIYDFGNDVTVDFNPESRKHKFRTAVIDKNLITAMFYNNKGAQALLNADYNKAYSYFVSAAKISPEYSSSYVNLGVLYRIHGNLELAEQAYEFASLVEPNNLTAQGNLAIVYDLTKRETRANEIRRIIEAKRSDNPYYAIAKGNEAYLQGEYSLAVKLYKDAVKLDNQLHESYFGLAKSYYMLGQLERAENALTKAKHSAFFESDRVRYSSKLEMLSSAH